MASTLVLRPYGLHYLLTSVYVVFLVGVPAGLLGHTRETLIPLVLGSFSLLVSLASPHSPWQYLVFALLASACATLPKLFALSLLSPAVPLGMVVSLAQCLGGIPFGYPGNPWTSLIMPVVSASSLFLPPSLFLATMVCAMMSSMVLPLVNPPVLALLGQVEVWGVLSLPLLARALQMTGWALQFKASAWTLPFFLAIGAIYANSALRARIPVLGPTLKHNPLALGVLLPIALFSVLYVGTSGPLLTLSESHQVRSALLYCLQGYTISALLAALQEGALDTVQIWGARGRRGATLDLYALAGLFTGGIAVLYTCSPKFHAFVTTIASLAVDLTSRGMPAIPLLWSLPLAARATATATATASAASPQQQYLVVEGIALLLTASILLQKTLATHCLLLAPIHGETSHRGNPFAIPPPTVALTIEVYGPSDIGRVEETLAALEAVGKGGGGGRVAAAAAAGSSSSSRSSDGDDTSSPVAAAANKKGVKKSAAAAAAGSSGASTEGGGGGSGGGVIATFLLTPSATTRDIVGRVVSAGHEVGLLGESGWGGWGEGGAVVAGGGGGGLVGGGVGAARAAMREVLKEVRGGAFGGGGVKMNEGAGAPALQDTPLWFRPSGGARDTLAIREATANGLRVALCTAGGESEVEVVDSVRRVSGGGVMGVIVSIPCLPSLVPCAVHALREASDAQMRGILERRKEAQEKNRLEVTPTTLTHAHTLNFATLTSLHAVPGHEVEAIADNQ